MGGRNIVLLTATIKPNLNQHKLIVNDSNERLLEYIKAMKFYNLMLNLNVIDNVVFVDNSGYDLSNLSSMFCNEKIEFLSFYDLDYPSDYHRGYGEFRLIDYAYKNSSIINGLVENDRVWKITGRYIIRNISRFIRFSPCNFDFYVNINDRKSKWVDMEIMCWNKKGYELLICDMWHNFSSPLPPEMVIFNIIEKVDIKKLYIINKFYYPLLILGRRGGDGSTFMGRFGLVRYVLQLVKKVSVLPFRYLKDREC